jgi:hypothetical protein
MSDPIILNGAPIAQPERSYLEPVVEEPGEATTRRFFLGAAGAAGLLYAAALAYPIYRYLASPE